MDKLDILEAINGTAVDQKLLDKLNDEQRAIVLAREQRRIERAELIAQARETTDPDVAQHIFDQILHMDGDMCEHERSIWSNCHACDEIERVFHPELFCAECGVPFSVISTEEAEKEHKAGDICPDCIYEKGHPKDRGAALQKCITCGWETGTSTITRDRLEDYDPRCMRCNTNTMRVIEGSFQVSERFKE